MGNAALDSFYQTGYRISPEIEMYCYVVYRLSYHLISLFICCVVHLLTHRSKVSSETGLVESVMV